MQCKLSCMVISSQSKAVRCNAVWWSQAIYSNPVHWSAVLSGPVQSSLVYSSSFTEASPDLSKDTTSQRVPSDSWLNFLHWDISRALLEWFIKRWSQLQAKRQLQEESKARIQAQVQWNFWVMNVKASQSSSSSSKKKHPWRGDRA